MLINHSVNLILAQQYRNSSLLLLMEGQEAPDQESSGSSKSSSSYHKWIPFRSISLINRNYTTNYNTFNYGRPRLLLW
jgi:hypothetical protein